MRIGPPETVIAENRKELLQHGTVLFPAAFYSDDIKLYPVPWHWHEELELGIVMNGTVVVKVDNENYVLHAGEGFFINSGVLHELWGYGEENGETYSIVFHPRLVGGSADSIFWQQYIQPLLDNINLKGMKLVPQDNWHREVLTELASAWANGVDEAGGYEFWVRNSLSRIIYLITENEKSDMKKMSSKAIRDDQRIKKMLQFIKEHYQEEIVTAQIAESAAISESECLRCFRCTIGTTPIQFLKEFRLQQAAHLLNTTEQKIVDIGIQCGFQDMSYFAKIFRRTYGCTPSEYRENLR